MCTKAPSAIHVQCAVCKQNRNAHSKSSSQYVSRIVAESVSGYHYSQGVFNFPVGNVSEMLIKMLLKMCFVIIAPKVRVSERERG